MTTLLLLLLLSVDRGTVIVSVHSGIRVSAHVPPVGPVRLADRSSGLNDLEINN